MTRLAFRRRTSPKVAIPRYNTFVPLEQTSSSAGADQGMARKKKQWMQSSRAPRPALPDELERAVIVTACEAFIRDVLETALPATDQADRMELRGRYPRRLGGGAISFHPALQVGHGA
jgi:hypothetical protein